MIPCGCSGSWKIARDSTDLCQRGRHQCCCGVSVYRHASAHSAIVNGGSFFGRPASSAVTRPHLFYRMMKWNLVRGFCHVRREVWAIGRGPSGWVVSSPSLRMTHLCTLFVLRTFLTLCFVFFLCSLGPGVLLPLLGGRRDRGQAAESGGTWTFVVVCSHRLCVSLFAGEPIAVHERKRHQPERIRWMAPCSSTPVVHGWRPKSRLQTSPRLV